MDDLITCPCCEHEAVEYARCEYCLDGCCEDCITLDWADEYICNNCEELKSHRNY